MNEVKTYQGAPTKIEWRKTPNKLNKNPLTVWKALI